jgi:lysophospholipase L1-like esterase
MGTAKVRPDSFVALGDSFTEGLDDARADGSYRGWADRVAEVLAAEVRGFQYANLAVRGRRLDRIAGEQVDEAVAMRPRLVSLCGGGNDILNPRCDPNALGRRLRQAVQRLVGTGATVVVFTGFNTYGRLPLGSLLALRTATYNELIRRAAGEFDAVLVDMWQMTFLRDARMWSEDRLHLSQEGHLRVAAAVLTALGRDPGFDWQRPPSVPAEPLTWVAARREDARWARVHFAPWVARHARGRSSGDQVTPKQPSLATFPSPRGPSDDLFSRRTS